MTNIISFIDRQEIINKVVEERLDLIDLEITGINEHLKRIDYKIASLEDFEKLLQKEIDKINTCLDSGDFTTKNTPLGDWFSNLWKDTKSTVSDIWNEAKHVVNKGLDVVDNTAKGIPSTMKSIEKIVIYVCIGIGGIMVLWIFSKLIQNQRNNSYQNQQRMNAIQE